MTGREKWRFVHKLNIYQIALLIEGYDPAEFENVAQENWSYETQTNTAAILNALRTAVEAEELCVYRSARISDFDFEYDYERCLIETDELRRWLRQIGLNDTFFNPAPIAASVDNPFGRYYAPKLAAANAAWEAVTSNPKLLRGKSPKKAIDEWLRAHAADYDLLNKDGTPNATGIEEIAKVANWKPGGGAPATPKPSEQGGVLRQTPGMVTPNPREGSVETFTSDPLPF